MNIKEQIIQEMEQVPEHRLEEVLAFVRSLKMKPPEKTHSKAVQAFLASLEERKQVSALRPITGAKIPGCQRLTALHWNLATRN